MKPTPASRQSAATLNRVVARRFRPELVALLGICGGGIVGALGYMGWKLATDGDLRRRPTGRFTFRGQQH